MPGSSGKRGWPQDAHPTPLERGHDVGNPGVCLPCRLEYLDQKRSKVTSEAERQMLEKQSREAEREVQDIR